MTFKGIFARPAQVQDVIEVKQACPRRRDDPELVALRRRVLGLLGNDQAAA
ncbi:hypothetical protein [Pantoea sp. KPR_PJ]|uniref:hypothetical protein n=1 Tax=Pantoea sp. KPR_PJ TaxID=2738375 RepID=UPI003527EAE1